MKKQLGFTLIELMVVVAIVAILAGIAYPSYQQHVLTTRRTEALSALTQLANQEEKYFMDNNTYGSLSNLGKVSDSAATSFNTENAYYSISLAYDSSTYTLTATAINQQAADTDCATLTINESGTKGSSTADASTCWK